MAVVQRAAERSEGALSEAKKAERRLGWLLCAPAALVMLLVTGYPIGYAVWLSFQRFDLKYPDEREFVGLDNYITVRTNEYWWSACWVPGRRGVRSVLLGFALGMGLALIMRRAGVGRGLVRTVSLRPYGIVTVGAAFSWRYAWTPDTGYLANLVTPEG